MKKVLLLLNLSLFFLFDISAQSRCNSNGANVWSTGFNCTSSSLNVYTIEAGDSIYYTQPSSTALDTLRIAGVLNFKNGSKIDMAADGLIIIESGGKVLGGNGGTKFRFANGVTITGPFNVTGPAYGDSSGSFNIGVLPVEFTEFSAEVTGEQMLCKWTTASEINNNRFEVELSMDATNYVMIDVVTSASSNGNSTQLLHYKSRTEFIPRIGVHTYYIRIKQIDHNDAYSYSEVIVVQHQHEQFHAYRCAQGEICIELNKIQTGQLRVYDASAQQIRNETIHDLSTTLSGLKPGVYILQLQTKHGLQSKKVAVY